MNQLHSKAGAGFNYVIEVVDRFGHVSQREEVHNLIPLEGLNHVMNVLLKAATQVPTWYIALYEGNYTPDTNTTAATFPAAATECTAYTPTSRVEFVEGTVAAGAADNSASRAEFTFTAAKTIYGGVITSAAAKGATTGVLISAVRFASPKVLDVGSTLRVTAGLSLVSA